MTMSILADGELQPNLFLSAFSFDDITYCAAGNSFAFYGIAPEDYFGVQLTLLRT
jgi:hypothetical protein